MLVQIVGGYFSNSLALLSDAGHMLTDAGGMLLSLFALWVARRPKTAWMSYGYHRAEILGALVSGLSIWALAGILVYEAISRIRSPAEVHAPLMMAVAAFGLGANLLSMKILHSHQERSLNIRGAYLHVLFDALGSVGVLIAGAVVWLTGWSAVDPMASMLLAGFMLWSSWSLIRDSVVVLMESAPANVDPDAIHRLLESVPGVREIHDLHIWSVSSGRVALSVHLISEKGEEALAAAHQLLQERFGIIHTTIQVEHPERFHSERCYDCN
jgi:cobalt-zinc-cadmium efflux system protein